MYTGTLFINPITNKVNGFFPRIFESGEEGIPVPNFLTGESGNITGISYLNPIMIITGYEYYKDLKYKTYNPETNSFV